LTTSTKTHYPSAWFRDCYGIVNDHTVPVETVVLRAFGREPHYLRDLPLHHTQRELTVTPDYTDFELTLRPTADFITPLLSRGAAIKVLSPEWLAQAVRQGHLDAARLYE
jgi:hypothetical protein